MNNNKTKGTKAQEARMNRFKCGMSPQGAWLFLANLARKWQAAESSVTSCQSVTEMVDYRGHTPDQLCFRSTSVQEAKLVRPRGSSIPANAA